ncbi:hypothetical protein FKW77_003426 [Venturia effusa]|uniref:Uncharacterized protein n=1 Tax=Venturia effusa TaxID=50376 RepID=A0A517L554_9PEZI|nr:hypothetical protein FKW77_003426 [Venturia effusa]
MALDDLSDLLDNCTSVFLEDSSSCCGAGSVSADSQNAMATIMPRFNPTVTESNIAVTLDGLSMAKGTAPNATSLMSTIMESIQAATATPGPIPTDASDSNTHVMPPISVALVVVSAIVLIAVSLLGLGCWIKRRRKPPSVHELVEAQEELDEIHELGFQHDDSHPSGTSSIGGSDEPQPIWLFPNGTALINGTILCHPNGTAFANGTMLGASAPPGSTTAISSTDITTSLAPTTRPNNDAGPDSNDGPNKSAGTSLTATEPGPYTPILTNSSTIPASAVIPAIVIPLILAVLIAVTILWYCHNRKHKEPEDGEKGGPRQFDSSDYRMHARLSRPPQDPAHVAWMDTPQQQQQPLQRPSPAYIARPSQGLHPHASSIYPLDHDRTRSPVSAYQESIRDSTRSPRRNSAVSALNYNAERPPLPALEDRQGHFMPRGYYYDQHHERRESRPPMNSVDALLSPRHESQQVPDQWRTRGTERGDGGYGGDNRPSQNGGFF